MDTVPLTAFLLQLNSTGAMYAVRRLRDGFNAAN